MSEENREPAGGNGPSPQTVPALAAILRMDLQGSSAAAQRDFKAFKSYMALLRRQVNRELYPSLLGENEGEGDSIRRAFTNIRDALRCAIFLRHRAQQPVQAKDGLYTLTPRIVLHFDEYTISDEGRIESLGQILVTELDHAVPPGEILVTEAFANIARDIDVGEDYRFEYLGPCKLDKSSKKHPCYIVTLTSGGTSGSSSRRYNQLELAIELLNQGDQSSQASAVEVLGHIESESASNQLIKVALDPEIDRRVRNAALIRLQERGEDINDTDIENVGRAFEEESWPLETRALLLFILGQTRRESVFDTLSNVVMMKPQKPIRLREAALLAMRDLRGKLIAETVEYALSDEEDEVRIAACVAARARMPRKSGVQKKLHEIVVDAELAMDLRNVACEALAAQQLTCSLRDILKEVVEESDYPRTLRRYALNGLAQFDDPTALRTIEEVARRRDDDLRADAMIIRAAMQPTLPHTRRRVEVPESHAAKVIEQRTLPQREGT